jgi:hypothetical protein
MTAHDKHANESRRLLERILDTVASTEERVEAIADKIDEYLEHVRYGRGWYSNGTQEE